MIRFTVLLGIALTAVAQAQDRGVAALADSTEVTVLHAVLRHWGAVPENYVAGTPTPLPFCSSTRRDNSQSACVPDSLRVEYGAAVDSFLGRQAQHVTLDVATLSQLGLQRGDSASWRSGGSCTDPTTFLLSPVGFDPEKVRAVVVVWISQGRGPHPDCGVAGGASLILRRTEDGAWVVVGTLDGWKS